MSLGRRLITGTAVHGRSTFNSLQIPTDKEGLSCALGRCACLSRCPHGNRPPPPSPPPQPPLAFAMVTAVAVAAPIVDIGNLTNTLKQIATSAGGDAVTSVQVSLTKVSSFSLPLGGKSKLALLTALDAELCAGRDGCEVVLREQSSRRLEGLHRRLQSSSTAEFQVREKVDEGSSTIDTTTEPLDDTALANVAAAIGVTTRTLRQGYENNGGAVEATVTATAMGSAEGEDAQRLASSMGTLGSDVATQMGLDEAAVTVVQAVAAIAPPHPPPPPIAPPTSDDDDDNDDAVQQEVEEEEKGVVVERGENLEAGDGLSTGGVAGIVVGGVFVAVAAAGYGYHRRKTRNAKMVTVAKPTTTVTTDASVTTISAADSLS